MRHFLMLCSISVGLAQTATMSVGTQNITINVPSMTLFPVTCLHAVTPPVDPSTGTPLALGETLTILPNQVSQCTATISTAAPAGGYTVIPFSVTSPLSFDVPSLVIPAGATSAKFLVHRGAA